MLETEMPVPANGMVGALEAARMLGIHRSTLNLAVRRGWIVPDARTPKGHVRFRPETLAQMRERLAGGSVTGDGMLRAPIHALAELGRLLAEGRPIEELAEAVLDGMRRALPGSDMCLVARVAPTPRDRLALRVIARWHVPDAMRADFARLSTTFRFAATSALRALEPEVCENTSCQPIHTGTAHLCRVWPIGAYAVFPIAACGEPLGVLVCVSQAPRRFAAHEREFLRGLAGALAPALARERRSGDTCASTDPLAVGHELLRVGLALRVRAREGARCEAGAALAARFKELTGAEQVCALGFPTELPADDPWLPALACRACEGDALAEAQWSHAGETYSGCAASVPLWAGQRAAVAAAWHGRRRDSCAPEADHALLVAFASAYLHATEPVEARTPATDGTDGGMMDEGDEGDMGDAGEGRTAHGGD